MSANRFGKLFQWTSFGESHGEALGVVIDGCPSGVEYNEELLLSNLERRRPGQNLTSPRQEKDQARILSGIYNGKTLGTPIAIIVENHDSRSRDYDHIKNNPRVGHADDLWKGKYSHSDHRGGGRASARETVARVMAGSIAQMFCHNVHPGINLEGMIKSIGGIETHARSVNELNKEVQSLLQLAKDNGESYGGVIEIKIDGLPKYLGQPVFHKLKNDLSNAYMSIGACCGVEFGGGFELAQLKGSKLHTKMKNKDYGGLRGGITTGELVKFRLAFKPTSSIQKTAKEGRHDPCIVPRAIPIVESMTWALLADHILWRRLDNI